MKNSEEKNYIARTVGGKRYRRSEITLHEQMRVKLKSQMKSNLRIA